MLCSYNKKEEEEKTSLGDEYGYGFDGDDGFMGVYLPPNSSSCIYFNTCSFLYVNNTSIKWFKINSTLCIFPVLQNFACVAELGGNK